MVFIETLSVLAAIAAAILLIAAGALLILILLIAVLTVVALLISYCIKIRVFAEVCKRKSGFIKKDAFAFIMFFSYPLYKINLLVKDEAKDEKKSDNKKKKEYKSTKTDNINAKNDKNVKNGKNGKNIKKGKNGKKEKKSGKSDGKPSRTDIILAKIKKNPSQFVSDTVAAFKRIKSHLIQLVVSLILAANINTLEFKLYFGLSNPADTGIVYGTLHSFKGGILGALSHHINKKKNKFKKLEKRLFDIVYKDFLFYPDMNEERLEFDFKMDISYRLISYYYPIIRFLLKRDFRVVVKNYIYPYFIKK